MCKIKCKYCKVCKIYDPKSLVCNEDAGSYYPDKYSGCHRDIDEKQERSEHVDKQKWEHEEWKRKVTWKAFVWFILLAVIIIGQAIPGRNFEGTSVSNFALFIHFCEFFAFAFATVVLGIEIFHKAPLTWSLVISIVAAAFGELIQLIIPGRSCTWLDFGMNMLGIFAAWVLIILMSILLMETILELGAMS